MLLLFLLGCVLSFLVHQQCQAQLTTCVTCTSCQDVYDGTDMNVSCAATTANANSCQKIRMQLPGTTLVFKTCAKNCQEQSIIIGPVRFDISCCTRDNCNAAGVIRLQPVLVVLSSLLFLIH